MKTCKQCGKELEDKAVVCTHCGCAAKVKKPLYKKWWFWTAIVVVTLVAVTSGGEEDTKQEVSTNSTVSVNVQQTTKDTEPEIIYEVIDLQTMLDDLEENALKAEKQYQKKHVEVTGKIANFDSDGSYISIEPVDADAWNFTTVMCYIKNDSQRDFLLEKSKGDTVTIKGQIITIGEVLGYSLNIHGIE